MEFTAIDDDVIFALCSKFACRDVVALSATCRRFHELLEDEFMWENLYKRDIGLVGADVVVESWRQLYKEAVRVVFVIPYYVADIVSGHI